MINCFIQKQASKTILTEPSSCWLETKPSITLSARVKINRKMKFIGALRRTLVQHAMAMSKPNVTAMHMYMTDTLWAANCFAF